MKCRVFFFLLVQIEQRKASKAPKKIDFPKNVREHIFQVFGADQMVVTKESRKVICVLAEHPFFLFEKNGFLESKILLMTQK
jgi:hypothetical protein